MNTTLSYGKEQIFTSEKMQRFPTLGRLVKTVFGYTNVGNYARFQVFKRIMRKMNLSENAKILDLGAGYGEYSFSLAKALPKAQVHALDTDAHRVATIERAIAQSEVKNVSTHCCELKAIVHKDFDFIFSIDVFEHILPEEMPFKAAMERLNPGGLLMVKIPNKVQHTILPEGWFEDHHHWLEDEHVGQVYNLEGLTQRFKEEGFDVVYSSCSDGWLSRLGWELAYLGKKAGLFTQLISLPVAKLLIHLDRFFFNGKHGNAIQVIGQKPQS